MSRYATPAGLCISSSPQEYPEPTVDQINERQELVEELARAEILRTDERFTQWFTDHLDGGDHVIALARHFAHCLQIGGGCHQLAAWQLEGQIVADYQAYRIEQEIA